MQDLSDFVFINMANITLARWNSYLNGIKHDGLAPLSTAPIHLGSLCPDNVIGKDEKEIAMMTSIIPAHLTLKRPGTTPTPSLQDLHRTAARNQDHQAGKCSGNLVVKTDKVEAGPPTNDSDRPRVRVLINDNYCVTQRDFVERAKRTETMVNSVANC